MYARVLRPGTLQAGDPSSSKSVPIPIATIRELNACFYHTYNAAIADRFIAAKGLNGVVEKRLRDKAKER